MVFHSSTLIINITSINRKFQTIFSFLGFTFSVICFSETWLDETTSLTNHYMNCQIIQVFIKWESKKNRGGVSLKIHQSLEFKIWNDLNLNSDDAESIWVAIILKSRKNTIFNALYKQRKGQIKLIGKFLRETFSRMKNSKKQFHVILFVMLIGW